MVVARELGMERERQFVQMYGRKSGRSNGRVSCDFIFSPSEGWECSELYVVKLVMKSLRKFRL